MSNNPLALTANAILDIPLTKPERVFTQLDLEKQWRRLRKKWHPDTTKEHETKTGVKPDHVFHHLQQLFKEAEKRVNAGGWVGAAVVTFNTKAGKTYRFSYRTMHEVDIGKMYVASGLVMFVVDKKNEDLFDNGIKMIKGIDYPPSLKKEFSRYFPTIKFADKTTDIGLVAIFEKSAESVLLQDWIDYEPDKHIEPKQVAWITSSLYNIATFLDHTGLCHNSIIPTAVFVDPVNHASYLLGGWWYATKAETKLKAVPGALLKTLPDSIFDTKIAKTIYDRKAVRGVAVACLGDPSMLGMSLMTRKDIPKPMVAWVRGPSGTDAIKEFTGWYETLEKCFGERKFIKANVTVDDIY